MAKKRQRRIIIFIFFKFLTFLIYLLPLWICLKIGQFLGGTVFYILKKEQKIALNNLDIAFGSSKSLKEKIIIVKQIFENMGRNFIEIMSLYKFNSSNIDNYVRCPDIGIIEHFIKNGHGGIVLSAHLGNWELMAHYFAIKGFKVNVIARRVRMERFEGILNSIRRRNRVNVLYRDAPAKEIISIIKKKEFIGIMPDQDIDSVTGVFVDFFGRLAWTPNGPAVLGLLTRVPIIPCFIVRQNFGHEILIGKEVQQCWTGNKDEDILETTQRYTRVIEHYIRRFPSQWVWFHERWKTKPSSPHPSLSPGRRGKGEGG